MWRIALVFVLLPACGDNDKAHSAIDAGTADVPPACLGLATPFPVQAQILTALAGDLNGDGRVDMVGHHGHLVESSVDVVLSNGDGTYGEPVVYPTGGIVDVVGLGDVTGDGHPDLLFTNRDSAQIFMLPNRGDGTFGDAVSLFTRRQSYTNQLIIADLNGDGLGDLVLLESGRGIELYRNTGNSTFVFTQSYYDGDGGHFPVAVAIADINHDSRPDLLLDSNIALETLEQRPNGKFVLRSSVAVDPNRDLAAKDFDGDGNVDVAILSAEVQLLRGDGTFTFTPVATLTGNAAVLLAVGDVDGDGALDVVTASNVALTTYRNLGNWSFTQPLQITVDPAVFFALGHVDGDATLDAVLSRFDGPTQLLSGASDGRFATITTRFATGAGPSGVASGDLDRDGRRDLVVVQARDMSLLLGLGDGTFAPRVTLSAGGLPTTAVVIADFNGDGHNDLLAVAHSASGLSDAGSAFVLFGSGGSSFEPGVLYTLGSGANAHVAVADFDADGDLDVVVARATFNGVLMTRQPGSLTLLRNDGAGVFVPTIVATQVLGTDTGTSFDTLGAADLDGDGDLDLVAGKNVFINQGGTFVEGSAVGLSGALGDLNGDAKPDIVATDDENIRVLLGQGDGTFALSANYSLHPSPTTYLIAPVTIADVDGDTRPDVLLPAFDGSSAFAVLHGNGDGTLAAPMTFHVAGTGSATILVDDFNADGRADVVITQQISDAVFVELGNCVP